MCAHLLCWLLLQDGELTRQLHDRQSRRTALSDKQVRALPPAFASPIRPPWTRPEPPRGARWPVVLLPGRSAAEALCCQTCAVQNILASILSRSTCFWRVRLELRQQQRAQQPDIPGQLGLLYPVLHGMILALWGSSLCSNTTFITL